MQTVLLLFAFLSAAASSSATFHNVARVTDNPADQLISVINGNRTAMKLAALKDNPGLACIALQYIKAYQGDCHEVAKDKRPPIGDFASTFAPACGVAVPSLAPITGRFVACQTKYVKPAEAFSGVIIVDSKSLDIVYSKNHTEVGAAVSGSDGGSPYFWCVLFSNGTSNSSFTPQNGAIKITRPGCFSGADDECSGAGSLFQPAVLWSFAFSVAIAVCCSLLF